jgi:hypothetical protein
LKRARVNPISVKRKAENVLRKERMEEKFGPREFWSCSLRRDIDALHLLGPCFGPINGHELLKRSRGGSITDMDNVVLLCSAHNEAVESHPLEAEKFGLSKHSWETL